MAHPARAKFFPYLREKLGDVPFSIDGGWGLWENCKRAWRLYDQSAEYHIVVQDDMIIGRGFVERAETLMTKDFVYNFYMGKRPRFATAVEKAMREKAGFIILTDLSHEACWGIKTSRIEEMLEYCDRQKPKNDRVLNSYIVSHKIPVLFPIPSFVDHRSEPSLHSFNVGKYPQGVRYFIGE